ncbi:curli-like amyloid fiber formation chaperone CsgH [Erythrobacter donghaensis]|uniref:curli-like amyloid fiber formation chaperone CsgH n=1 Tax=Erythrobacter donghaensis TaxID=267135 RepID=UPI000A38FEF5|nr:curli-like amyloid fiber formation chaperone CsgH [Erythrobacter donghaensis]
MTLSALPAGALALALLSHTTVSAMPEQPHALTLDVHEHDGTVEIQLIGHSPRAQAVSYALEVTGQSTSRHRGATTLAADTRAVLSTMRTNVGADWCVKLTAEEEGRAPYEITRGPCTAG